MMTGRDDERLRPLAAGVRGGVGDRLGDVWWSFMLRGVLAAALGIAALLWPSVSLAILLRLVGIYCLLDGIAGVIGALRSAERPYLAEALVGILVGLVLLFWPGATTRFLLMVFGAWALFSGLSRIFAARRGEVWPEERGSRTTVGAIVAGIGLILLLWPGAGVVTIAWLIGIAALLIAALLIFLALRLKRMKTTLDVLAR